ncbi:GDP-D-glucose phosphorylase 1 [Gryllus bimaculatus]|nr:GDP-D-glucose phosphorylase 1 [Gryllus bimaculatus]
MSFTYSENDFIFETSWGDSAKLSSFDVALQTKWQSAVDNGYFRYTLNILNTKRLPGKFSFLAQLNPDRGTNRRPPEDINSLTQPFDHKKFNFTKINENEILFEVKRREKAECELKSRGKDLLVINISPLEFGHSLFLPELFSCLPQVMTLYSLQRTIELVLLSKSPSVHKLTSYLQECNIAHNVYITRGQSFNSNKERKILDSVRVYVWARKHSTEPKNVQCFDPAICELFGHLVVKVPEPFGSLSESEVASELSGICQEPFDLVFEDVREMFCDSDSL